MAKAKPEYCKLNCRYHKIGTGFAPDRWQGPIDQVKMALLLEGAGYGEIEHRDPNDGYGAPLIGRTGQFFDYHILRALGIPRSALLIGNVIRCRPPMNAYPTAKLRADAEAACRHWDEEIIRFNADWIIHTYHPSAIFKKPQLIEFVKESMRMAWAQTKLGKRPLVTMGVKSMNLTEPWLKGGLKKWQRAFGDWSYSSSVSQQ